MRLLLLLIPAVLLPLAPAQDLPSGKGSKLANDACSACHTIDPILHMNGSKEMWTDVINDMMGRGAEISDDQFKTILDYLSKYFGTDVNINTAAAADLTAELDLADKDAQAIVQYRTDKGKFKAMADLEKVPGIEVRKLSPYKARIKF